MKNRSGEKIKLASIDELLGVVNEESAMEIEISKIHPFKNHPFKVLDDEKMQDLVESVKINGVLTPVLLRMDENEEYEMVSGHRRMHAAPVSYTHLDVYKRQLCSSSVQGSIKDNISIPRKSNYFRDYDKSEQFQQNIYKWELHFWYVFMA